MLNVYLPNDYEIVIFFQKKRGPQDPKKEVNYWSSNCRIALLQPGEMARTRPHHRLTLYRWQPKILMPRTCCRLQRLSVRPASHPASLPECLSAGVLA